MIQASIVGGSGYTGGELLRLLLGHPDVEVSQVTSRALAGKLITTTHPNLRKRTTMKYVAPDALTPCDVLFLCLPHGASASHIQTYLGLAEVVIDLSADFRLHDSADYPRWYGWKHPHPDLLPASVYGLPEFHRDAIREARFIASPGCMATASILAIAPLARRGLLDPRMPIVVEAKTGSSGSGGEPTSASHHPERSGVVRSFKPTGHRHTAEIAQEVVCDCGSGSRPTVSFTATAVEAVRGILATAHVFTEERLTDKDLWQVYRAAYRDEPFVRLVKESTGIHRSPEPKILSGTNFCDVGFEADPHSNRVVLLAAIDNLMKGASGQAVQSMNIRMGFDETAGLEFMGLHPV